VRILDGPAVRSQGPQPSWHPNTTRQGQCLGSGPRLPSENFPLRIINRYVINFAYALGTIGGRACDSRDLPNGRIVDINIGHSSYRRFVPEPYG